MSLSEIAYEAYREAERWNNPKLIPPWYNLTSDQMETWQRVAEVIRDEIGLRLVREITI